MVLQKTKYFIIFDADGSKDPVYLETFYNKIKLKKTNVISTGLIKKALSSYQIDEKGLDSLDRQYLSFLNQNYNIPTGLDSIAACLGDDSSMLEFVVEPYLIKIGFLTRTPRGRLLTALGKKYIDSKDDNF